MRMRLLPLLLLLPICAVGSGALDSYPSDHGFANEPPAAAATPAMRGFFLNGSSMLPEAAGKENRSVDPLWDLVGRPVPHYEPDGGGTGRRRRLLAAGIACGAAGAGLLAVVVALNVLQWRRERRPPAALWAELPRVPEPL